MTTQDSHTTKDSATSNGNGWLARLYHENTNINEANLLEFEARIQEVAADPEQLRPQPAWQPSLDQVCLPRQRWPWGLDRLIRRRRTVRHFSSHSITLGELSRLLQNAAGVTQWPEQSGESVSWPLRSIPSAGALYPLELRVAALNVKGLFPGVYRYQPYEHCLDTISREVPCERLARASLHPDLVTKSAVVFAVFSDWRSLILKYSDRGYRFALFEAGHLAQNLLLTCTACQLAAVPIGGFLDDEIETVFDAASPAQRVLYLIVVGSCGSGRGDARLLGHAIGDVGGIEQG